MFVRIDILQYLCMAIFKVKEMKKFILTLMVASCSMLANAQVWIGGSLGFNVTKPENGESITTLVIAPEVGYNFNEKWGFGVALEEAALFNETHNGNAFSIAPFGRFSFARVGIANFFIDGGILVGCQNFDEELRHTDSHTTFGIGVRPGVKLELNHHLALEAKTGYLGYRYITDVAHQFGFGVNNEDLSLGLVYEF